MADDDIHARISQLVDEEHQLRSGHVDRLDRQRLAELELRLDQLWDLLRQRQARRDAGHDPDAAEPRPAAEVESYEQ